MSMGVVVGRFVSEEEQIASLGAQARLGGPRWHFITIWKDEQEFPMMGGGGISRHHWYFEVDEA